MEEKNVYLIKSKDRTDIHIVASDISEAAENYREFMQEHNDYDVQIDSITRVTTVWCKRINY